MKEKQVTTIARIMETRRVYTKYVYVVIAHIMKTRLRIEIRIEN